ncbi:hypothetical protein BEN74_18690 [Acinetobacter sp. WCHAc010034]|uniref:hypothetical protein n=1 Tax=Acinetobacter sp. WCHAc010034 TaxID=1879049 RepID=UPI00083A8875|nr:hypothetical protein [Acinetobacter sp. WCHAc010034]AYA04612.1 hypothetical protein BEN74_18690 [Acinetobacter sp. WCHAc010034]
MSSQQFSKQVDARLEKMREITMQADQFERRMGILIFAVHAPAPFSITDIQGAVLDTGAQSIRTYLLDLMSLGYVERETIWTYQATDKTKQLFGVKV